MDRYEERAYGIKGGTILVRNYPGNADGSPWLVTWLPDDQSSRNYPGFTVTSDDRVVPVGPTLEDVATWAQQQPFAMGVEPATPFRAVRFDLLIDDDAGRAARWAEVQRAAFERGFLCGYTREPDASWSWGVFRLDGYPVKSGVADTWDDAVLSIAENIHPVSGEQ
jgi:hypothetical protein